VIIVIFELYPGSKEGFVGRATKICVVAAHICFSSRWELELMV